MWLVWLVWLGTAEMVIPTQRIEPFRSGDFGSASGCKIYTQVLENHFAQWVINGDWHGRVTAESVQPQSRNISVSRARDTYASRVRDTHIASSNFRCPDSTS